MARLNSTVPGSAKPKGKPRGGSRKDIPNKATADARAAIALFVDSNADRLTGWLDEVAAENPAKAFELFQSVIEYHVPKLARTVIAGDEKNPVQVHMVKRVIVDSNG